MTLVQIGPGGCTRRGSGRGSRRRIAASDDEAAELPIVWAAVGEWGNQKKNSIIFSCPRFDGGKLDKTVRTCRKTDIVRHAFLVLSIPSPSKFIAGGPNDSLNCNNTHHEYSARYQTNRASLISMRELGSTSLDIDTRPIASRYSYMSDMARLPLEAREQPYNHPYVRFVGIGAK